MLFTNKICFWIVLFLFQLIQSSFKGRDLLSDKTALSLYQEKQRKHAWEISWGFPTAGVKLTKLTRNKKSIQGHDIREITDWSTVFFVPILALLQINSAEFSDKQEIIIPVIATREKFLVALNEQKSNKTRFSQPTSCFFHALDGAPCGWLIKRFYTCDHVVYSMCECFRARERESFQSWLELSCERASWVALFLWRLSALCLLHLIISGVSPQRGDRNHWEHHGPALLNGSCVWDVSLCVGVCARKDQIYLMARHSWHEPRVKRPPTGWDPYCAATTHDTHTLIPGVCPPPPLDSQVVLRFDLHTVGQLKPPSLSSPSSISLTLSLSPWLCFPPCSRLDGWPNSLGVFRFWRDPNFLF